MEVPGRWQREEVRQSRLPQSEKYLDFYSGIYLIGRGSGALMKTV